MEFVQAKLLLDHPAARLLRLPSAAFVLAFLDEAFHAMASVSVAEDSLRMRLERWLVAEDNNNWSDYPCRAFCQPRFSDTPVFRLPSPVDPAREATRIPIFFNHPPDPL